MSRGPHRQDIALAAYAVSLGYEIRGASDAPISLALNFDADGIPVNGLQFKIGDIDVWETSRGWRVARLVAGTYERARDSDFYEHLRLALEEGARNWRDR